MRGVDDDFCQQDLADKALPGSLPMSHYLRKSCLFSLNVDALFLVNLLWRLTLF
jgi:hypothetical protein